MTKTAKAKIERTEVKTRPSLMKVLDTAKIIPSEIRGRGKSLEVTLNNVKDYNKFTKHISNRFRAYSTGWGGWVVQLNQGPLPGSEHDYCNVASRHHY